MDAILLSCTTYCDLRQVTHRSECSSAKLVSKIEPIRRIAGDRVKLIQTFFIITKRRESRRVGE